MARRKAPAAPQEGVVRALSHEGRGITDVEGKTVFVADALPGETVRFQVERRRRKLDEGRLLEVLEASSQRVEPSCAAFGNCGGCSLQHFEHAGQIAHKEQVLYDALARIAKVDVPQFAPAITGPAWGYRRKARLGVKHVFKKDRVLVGFRERQKPYIADMQRCEVLDESLADLPTILAELIGQLSIAARLPQVEVATGDKGVALIFRVLDPPTDTDLGVLAEFAQRTGMAVLLQPGGPDTIKPLSGSGVLSYALPDFDVRFEFSATDFVQVNREVNRALVAQALDWLELEPTHQVLDLFCGLGNFTLPIARCAGDVTGVEGAESLVAKARSNARLNQIENTTFHMANLEALDGRELWLKTGYDRVLLDPARAGADKVLPWVLAMQPERVIYVSCHPATLARDVGIMVDEHGYTLQHAGIADMFPHTGHVESIVALTAP